MKIELEKVTKKFQKQKIFSNISCFFETGNTYALLGVNGSGKSTLLRIIAGIQTPSSGKVHFYNAQNNKITTLDIFPNISFCAPGMEIVEELTLFEFLTFHFSFKKPLQGITIEKIVELTGLKDSAEKHIGDFSSGMKQRVKLAQAIFSDTPILLLDEPCTNLDEQGVEQYRSWVQKCTENRLLIVASNDEREYSFCGKQIYLNDYK